MKSNNILKKPYMWTAIYAVFIILFTLYATLDTFVIPRSYVVIDDTTETSAFETTSDITTETSGSTEVITVETTIETTTEAEIKEPIITDNSYIDENISITLTEYREYYTDIYVADIVLSSPEYLKTAFARNTYGRNITAKTSATAAYNNAILAVNGDYYGARQAGYVLRGGVIYRAASSDPDQEDLVIYSDGSFEIITEGPTVPYKLRDNGAVQIFSFGPGLIKDGEIIVSENDEVAVAYASNPRTAIGIIDNLHYVLIVSDGRTAQSAGLSLLELAEFMKSLGVTQAYNLDGGGSSLMYFNGKVINVPTTDGKHIVERSVSDIVYIGY